MLTYLPPLDFVDTSIFLATSAILLLITSQIVPAIYGLTDFRIEKKKLDNAAIVACILFLIIVASKIIEILIERT